MVRNSKIKIATLAFLFAMFSFCNQNEASKSTALSSTADGYQTGDCFEFKEKIQDFGLIFIKENLANDESLLSFFPVKLDTAKSGIEKFIFGKVYLSSFEDYTTSSGKTEGFMGYTFLDQQDFQFINTLFHRVGTVKIPLKYRNLTGGTMASNYDEFRYQLNRWHEMFKNNGKQVSMAKILE